MILIENLLILPINSKWIIFLWFTRKIKDKISTIILKGLNFNKKKKQYNKSVKHKKKLVQIIFNIGLSKMGEMYLVRNSNSSIFISNTYLVRL